MNSNILKLENEKEESEEDRVETEKLNLIKKRASKLEDENDESEIEKKRIIKLEGKNEELETDNRNSLELRNIDFLIKRVILENFMCHKKLDFKIEKGITFVLGKNGSGKSAILSGIMVGFGGIAKDTTRAKKLEGFIRDGVTKSKIKLVINCKKQLIPELSSNELTIETQITSKNKIVTISDNEGKRIRLTNDELKVLRSKLGLDIENPVIMLTQERAKSFLISSSEKNKYECFYTGTGLKLVNERYKRALIYLERYQNILKIANLKIEELNQQINVTKQIIDKNERFFSYLNKLKLLNKELEESKIISKKKEIIEKKLKYDDIKTNLKEIEEKINNNDQKLEDYKNVEIKIRDTMDQELNDIHKKISDLEHEKQKIIINAKINAEKIESAKQVTIKTRNEIEKFSKNKLEMPEGLDDCKDKLKKLNEEKEKMENIIDQKTKEENYAYRKIKETENNIEDLESKIIYKNKRILSIKKEINSLGEKMMNMDQNDDLTYKHLSNSGRASINLRRKIDNLIKDNPKAFKSKIFGPIFLYIKVKDPKFIEAVRAVFDSYMYSFIVLDSEDNSKIFEIMKSNNLFCDVIHIPRQANIKANSEINLENNESFKFLSDHIEIDNPMFKLYLDNIAPFKKMLVVEKIEIARPLIKNLWERKIYIKNAVTLNGQIITISNAGEKIVRWISSGGNPFKKYCTEEILKKIKDQIKELKKSLENENIENENLINDKKILKEKIEEFKIKISKIREFRKKLEAISQEINELEFKFAEKSFNSGELIKISLEERLSNYEKIIFNLTQEGENYQENLSLIDKIKEETQENLTKLREEIREANQKKQDIRSKISKLMIELNRDKNRFNELNNELDNLDLKEINQEEVDENLFLLNIRNENTINEEIANFNGKIEALAAKNLVNAESLPKFLEKLNQNLTEKNYLESKILELEKLHQKFNSFLEVRKKLWSIIISKISVKVGNYFSINMARNNMYGEIIFNHDKSTLKVCAVPIKNKLINHDIIKEVSSLSGGEKSITILCFLLAIWDASNTKLRCLDEFDIFMDVKARVKAVEILLENARKNYSRNGVQYMFISPLFINQISKNLEDIQFCEVKKSTNVNNINDKID